MNAAILDLAKLREQAATVKRTTGSVRWQLQTSNSFRRIGTARGGDGDVLCGTKHPIDAHPDLREAQGVLDYIVATQPSVVLELLDLIDRLRADVKRRQEEK